MLKELHRHEENLNQHDKLDLPISETEIRNATKKLKRNKSTYSDRIKNEMLKYSINFMLQAYVKLFNLILKAGIFPTQWCEGLITPIFKSDDRSDCNNYKGCLCDVTLSVYPHRAGLKNMPGHGGNRTYDLWNTSPTLCQLSYAVRSVRVCNISELSLVP